MTEEKKGSEHRPKNDIQALLASDAFKDKVSLALPKHLTPERFIRVACNALLRTPKLLGCSQASLMKALLDLSTFGLEPDGRRAHLIPFGDEVQLIIDYKGLVELVRRSGDVSYIHADVVGKHDLFDYQFGSGAKLVHKPALNDRGEIYAAYSFIRLKDGSEDFDVMGLDELDAIRRRSKTYNPKTRTNQVQTSRGLIDTPWHSDANEMYKKTVFRRHSKWQPFSSEVLKAISYGEEEEFGKKGFDTAKPVFSASSQLERKSDLSFLTSGNIGGDEIGEQKSEAEKLTSGRTPGPEQAVGAVSNNDDQEGIGHDE